LKRLSGRTALVTGASRGIGAAVALMMAEQGADVAVNFRSKGSRAEAIANQVQAPRRRALLRTLDAVLPLMRSGGSIVFVTSHLAHFYGRKPVYGAYEPIAASKKPGEDALRSRMAEFEARGIRLAIVSGDMIEGTITPKLLERTQRGLIESRRAQAGALPTVQEFAAAIVDAAADAHRPNGHVSFVGPTD
jgi:3-oxoacyl-[acyl-carrier protein] reductase